MWERMQFESQIVAKSFATDQIWKKDHLIKKMTGVMGKPYADFNGVRFCRNQVEHGIIVADRNRHGRNPQFLGHNKMRSSGHNEHEPYMEILSSGFVRNRHEGTYLDGTEITKRMNHSQIRNTHKVRFL